MSKKNRLDQMSDSNMRIARNTIMLYIRMFFITCVTLYTSRIILKTLGVEDFGIYNVVGGVVAMFSFINSSISCATQRFLTFELGKENQPNLQKVFSMSIYINIIISIFVVVLAETVGLWFLYNKMIIPSARFHAAFWVYQISIFSAVVMIMSAPYNAIIIAREKMDVFAYISIFEVIFRLLIVYLLLVFSYDKLILYAILTFCVQLLVRFIYGWYCGHFFSETKICYSWDKPLFKQMLSFAGWTMIGNFSVICNTQGLNILLNLFFGPVVNAARAISIQIQSALVTFSNNFQTAFNPQITKNYASGDLEHMHSLLIVSSKFSFFLIYFISLPLFIEMDQVLKWWLVSVPAYTVSFARWMILANLIDILGYSVIISVHATGRIRKFQLIEGGILLSVLPIAYLFLKFGYSPNSVFIVYFFITILAQIARLVIALPMIKLSMSKYFSLLVSRIFVVSIISPLIPVIIYFSMNQNVLRFVIIGITSILSTLTCIYLVGLNKNEKVIAIDKLYHLFHKIKQQQDS